MTVAVALVLLPAACNSASSRSAKPPSATTSTSAATTTTVDPTTAAILAAYRAEWADVIAVSSKSPVNPLDPRLAVHATGKQLSSVQSALSQVQLKGHYELGTIDLNPVVTSVGKDTATIMECDFDHSVEVDVATGQPVDKPDIGHTMLKFTMTRINGSWFVSDSTTLLSGKTIDACMPSAA